MTNPVPSFRDFERAGWDDSGVCANYHAHFSSLTRQSIDPLLEAAGVRSGLRVLDVATGAGYVAGAAGGRGALVVGVDFSATQVAMARDRYPTVRFEQADADALPFPAEQFDAVVCNFGMCHFPDPDAALREVFRILKRGGRVAFTVWDAPERALGLGAFYGAIRAHGSMDVDLPVGPNFFLFSDPEQSKQALAGAGFASPSATQVPQTWRLSGPDELFEVVMQATVRTSAALRAQTPEAREAIKAAVRDAISACQRGDHYEVPMPAVLAAATKPL